MTAAEAISAADALRPGNPYSTAQKTAWLSALDGRIHIEVMGGAASGAPAYTAAGAATATLLAAAPYDAMYPAYLTAQTDFADMEWEAYAVSSRMYNALYDAFAKEHIRKNAPQSGSVKY